MNIIRKLMISIMVVIIFASAMLCMYSHVDADFKSILKDTTSGTDSSNVSTQVKSISQSVITIVQVIGVGVAVIMLIVLGMKYMVSAPEDKAQIKKHAVVYVIGAVVLFGASGILQLIKMLASSTGSAE